ncbi:unnamed protein product [marine sediment metagenome]|uniref:Glycosyltransferase family 1 protein n=1 Tax=marine sediment metagenome TaxID=412755 RepID=X1F6A5_9ZZZZ
MHFIYKYYKNKVKHCYNDEQKKKRWDMANILIVCPFDNGQQGVLLLNALNKYTKHEARCLTLMQTYLNYDTDILWSEQNTPMKRLELRSLLADNDFFIFSEYIPWDIMNELGLSRTINNHNTIIRVGGSYCRKRANDYLMLWLREGFMLTGGAHDWTLASKIGRIAPTRNICPVDKILEHKPHKDTIRVAFAPTKKAKGTNEFSRVMDTLMKKYDNVEAVPITAKSWRETIEIKSKANVTFNSIWRGGYGNSAIESMYLSHAVLSRLNYWNCLFYPDLPIIHTPNEQDLYERLKFLIENPEEIKEWGKKGKAFVETYHSPQVVVKQWERLIEHVKTI